MKYKLLILALMLGYSQINAQNLLTPQWKFQTGDDLNWAKPETDDSGWAVKQEGFILTLGRIDDADYTYLNGGGFGGMYTSNIALKIAGVEDFLIISPAFKETNRILVTHDPVTLPVGLKNTSSGKLKGKLVVTVVNDFKEKIAEKTVDNISVSKKSTAVRDIILGNLPAGFYNVAVSFQGNEVNTTTKFSFGVNPEEIVSPPDPQADFENYWDRAKKELAAVDPQYKLTRIDSLCTRDKEWYLLEMRSLGNVLIRGYYGKPVKPGKYPAILHVQGYSSAMIPQWGYQGSDMVSLALNIRGHGNSKDNIDPGFREYPGYLQYQLHDKEMYIYRGAYMDCRRAVDFLFSRPEVDNTRIAVEGGSQGGALTFATAALNNDRIAVAVPAVPFLSDFPHYFRVANWPGNEFVNYVKDHPEIGWEKVYETLSYIDIKNLAGWIKCPVLMGVGLIDETCPPHINFAAYNQLSVPKEYIVYPESGHGLPGEFHDRMIEFIKKHFGIQ